MSLERQHKAFLKQHQLFNMLRADAFGALTESASLRTEAGRTILFWEGQRSSVCYVLFEGLVELFAKAGSRKASIDLLVPPAAFLLSNVFGQPNPVVSARTIRKSVLIVIPSRLLRTLALGDPAFGTCVAAEISATCDQIMKQFSSHNLMYGVERVATYLLSENRRQGDTGVVRLATRKSMLASSLGLAPESLSRALAMLRKCAIEVHGNEIRLVDLEQLAKVAGQKQHLGSMPVLKRSKARSDQSAQE